MRYEERGFRLPPGALGTKLGALRLPEREIIFDDGSSAPLPTVASPPLSAAATEAREPSATSV